MKIRIYFCAISIVIATNISAQSIARKIKIEYLGCETLVNIREYNMLKFEIQNLSKDTLYLGELMIRTIVTKNGKTIKSEKMPPHGFFVRPVLRKRFVCNEETQYLNIQDSLKRVFAVKLYKKNFLGKSLDEDCVESLKDNCLIIYPNSNIEYTNLFLSKSLDKSCRVKAVYSESLPYFTYLDGKKEVRIMY